MFRDAEKLFFARFACPLFARLRACAHHSTCALGKADAGLSKAGVYEGKAKAF
jgi:hypothetical protein